MHVVAAWGSLQDPRKDNRRWSLPDGGGGGRSTGPTSTSRVSPDGGDGFMEALPESGTAGNNVLAENKH